MELLLAPILFAVQFAAWMVIAFIGFVFNALFRRGELPTDGSESLKPENPWQVFFSSLLGTIVLASIGAGVSYYTYETSSAAWKGFGAVGFVGLLASITAATGEPPAM